LPPLYLTAGSSSYKAENVTANPLIRPMSIEDAIKYCLLLFASVVNFMFVYGVIEDLVSQWLRKNGLETITDLFRAPSSKRQSLKETNSGPLGYENSDRFGQNAVTLIHELEREIASDKKEIEQIRSTLLEKQDSTPPSMKLRKISGSKSN
jgi:hypothetical protein